MKPGTMDRVVSFLTWARDLPEGELAHQMAPKPAKQEKCWRCQRGRGLYLCLVCASDVKSYYRTHRCEKRGLK